jgi:tripartite-type tricarboxylate transporter receptor subunit TctC
MKSRNVDFHSLAVITFALAQPYPARALRIIVPNPAGTGQDVETRQLTQLMSPDLGVPIVVENRPGGSQSLGMEIVAKATPDGYTLGLAQSEIFCAIRVCLIARRMRLSAILCR